MVKRTIIIAGFLVSVLALRSLGSGLAFASERPNIVLIMADDMGFSDIGCYGSEIPTPNLDRLAREGIRFRQFYNTGRCCPTRASLLTGLYSHQAGVGHMTSDAGEKFPGYRGRLMPWCVTIAEVLRPAGYFTAIVGKWHVGHADRSWWPLSRGFDRFFGVPEGGGFYYTPNAGRSIVLDNQVVYDVDHPAPDGWYTTDAFVDYGIRFVDEAVSEHKPFFLYVAFNAPHWPLQAPAEDIARFDGMYDRGWDAVREARLARQREMGLIDEHWELSPPNRVEKDWNELTPEARRREADAMEVYAAVVWKMDAAIGRLLRALEERGLADNTVVMFLSDNGGCAEGGAMAKDSGSPPLGAKSSFLRYGKSWANASNTPFRYFKHYVHEGGIATPLIVRWPKGIPEKLCGKYQDQPAHVIDLMATCADLAGARYPDTRQGQAVVPLEGKSMVPLFQGGNDPIHDALFWEHEGNRAVRVGDWKLVARGAKSPWELYNMKTDRTELHDLAAEQPERVAEMSRLWHEWAKRAHVVPNPHGWFESETK
ncbi:arylsulfatase [Thermostilla marina]